MLTQGTATPLYVQLMNEVEKSILSGAYQPGDKLMTEAEMAAVLDPKLYTGRCAAQVEAFLEGIVPLLAEAESGDTPEINV